MPGNAAPAAGQAQQKGGSSFLWTIMRMFLLWWFIRNFFGQRSNMDKLPRQELLMPKYEKGYPLDIAMYLAEIPHFSLHKCVVSCSHLLAEASQHTILYRGLRSHRPLYGMSMLLTLDLTGRGLCQRQAPRRHWNDPNYILWKEDSFDIGESAERNLRHTFKPSKVPPARLLLTQTSRWVTIRFSECAVTLCTVLLAQTVEHLLQLHCQFASQL